MIGLRNKYCLSFFKAILVAVGLIFLVAQASFKFYRFASFPFSVSSIKANSPGAISGGTSKWLNHEKQVRTNLLLDKRYDLKHVFVSPSPFLLHIILPVDSNNYLSALHEFYAAGVDRPVCMRGPPNMV
jgi:hypothetical protein